MTAVAGNPSNSGFQLIDTPPVFKADYSACLLNCIHTTTQVARVI